MAGTCERSNGTCGSVREGIHWLIERVLYSRRAFQIVLLVVPGEALQCSRPVQIYRPAHIGIICVRISISNTSSTGCAVDKLCTGFRGRNTRDVLEVVPLQTWMWFCVQGERNFSPFHAASCIHKWEIELAQKQANPERIILPNCVNRSYWLVIIC